jgi:hypothetical protein
LGKELEKRLLKLERAMLGVRESAPYWEDLERRARIGNLYLAWWFEGGEKPDLSHPRDRYWWAYMEQIREVSDELAADGALGRMVKEET